MVSGNNFISDPELTDAIRKFPTPRNNTDHRAFFGLRLQVGNFSNKIATALGSLAPLLKKGYLWEWTTAQSDAFTNARSVLGKCRQFLEGLPRFELVADHEPLVPILKD